MNDLIKRISTLSAALLFVSSASSVLAEDLAAKGKSIYDGAGACASCHGATGEGDGAAAAALDPKPRSFADGEFKYDTDEDGTPGTDADLLNILKNGTVKYGGAATMPARPDIADEDLKALIAYIRTLKK